MWRGRICDSTPTSAFITYGDGFESLNTAVVASGVSTSVRLAQIALPRGCSLRQTSSAENLRSAEVNGLPSCHFTSLRKVKRNSLASGESFQEVASFGVG